MKYPIAHVDKVIDRYGADVGAGYDIMCEFMKTLRVSSISDKVRDSRLVGIVPAFHSHAHSRSCQVWWHPLYIEGLGLIELEDCERLFARSNELATGTRMCTPFHRRQQILEFLQFNDLDKYALHGKLLYSKYREALRIISNHGAELSVLEDKLKTTAQDYEDYLSQERAYLDSLRREPPEVTQKFEYMEALERLQKAIAESRIAQREFERLNEAYERNEPVSGNVGKIKARYTRTANRVVILDEEVSRLEDVMGLDGRWTPESPEFVACSKEMGERRYRRALDELERLVVQRLLELTKLNMSGVGVFFFLY
ncbi:hypothetical protein FISHEDRAFT_40870 [Fistulina hepatica ATCC 64428]|uniref:Uncharacterized protein n=1 Tax=Fistulina hepatica ATCC 64428 TaxID=1128425 RepID=A0A0D7AFQ4_9AGAR|nr:hypothetical protein FISHEDRAFT_40870 [Fistulina hepatica ATCC 64428]